MAQYAPTADSLAGLTGVAPTTREPGKSTAIIPARAWITVIRACCTTHTPNHPDRHSALQRILNQDQPGAA